MLFNRHDDLQGRHAFLSPSQYHWLRYDEQKLAARYTSFTAARKGTALHKLAHDSIQLGVRLHTSHKALAAYVKDAIGYKMDCEVPLHYSDNCFGHADTISFRRNTLRIHDLKTGITKVSMEQLHVYAALFCLEYGYNPFEIQIELRIYQGDGVQHEQPPPELIADIMDTIVEFDQYIEAIKEGR